MLSRNEILHMGIKREEYRIMADATVLALLLDLMGDYRKLARAHSHTHIHTYTHPQNTG